ncbi:MAG: hypothetical protein IJP77_06975 [Bacteroidales bacterium]|nr:hypothetical protein [Bacteroidales bacterium]
MKQIALLLLTLIVSFPSLATEQEPERLVLNGKEYGMQYLPLYDLDTLLQHQIEKRIEVDPAHIRVMSTGLWRGYVGYWSIQDDYLYLDSLQVCIDVTDNHEIVYRYYGYEDLNDLLSAYCHDGRIRADWVSRDSVRVCDYRSERLLYAHLGFSSRFSKELFCSFRKGLLYTLSYKNHLFHEGVPFDMEQRTTLSASFPYDQFPELKGRGYISIYVRDIQVDENGRIVDCRLSIGGTALKGLGNEESLAEQIVNWARKKMLSTDWQVYECDGINTLGYWSQIDLRFGWKRRTM